MASFPYDGPYHHSERDSARTDQPRQRMTTSQPMTHGGHQSLSGQSSVYQPYPQPGNYHAAFTADSAMQAGELGYHNSTRQPVQSTADLGTRMMPSSYFHPYVSSYGPQRNSQAQYANTTTSGAATAGYHYTQGLAGHNTPVTNYTISSQHQQRWHGPSASAYAAVPSGQVFLGSSSLPPPESNTSKIDCPLKCGKTFGRAQDVERHLKSSCTHSRRSSNDQQSQGGYRCPICNTGLSREDALYRHMRVQHGVDPGTRRRPE